MGKSVGITVFGYEQDKANVFHALSSDFHVIPTLISDVISADNAKLATGNQCTNVGHKSEVSEATVLAPGKVGAKYISTYSTGCDHVDTTAAEGMGISVGTVAYSPGSVADHTLILMLVIMRGVKPTMYAVAQ